MSPRAVRHGQGGPRRSPAQRRDLRHHDRLALRQPADEGALRHRLDARDGGERGGGVRHRAARTRTPSPLRSQARWAAAQAAGRFAEEIVPVAAPAAQGRAASWSTPTSIRARDHARGAGRSCKPRRGPGGTVTAGNASGVNDGAAALLVASEEAAQRHGLTPERAGRRHGRGRRAAAHHGHRPGARDAQGARARRPDARRHGRDRAERGVRRAGAGRACASSALPTTRPHVNPNGGAIALGHPLGMSGARLVTTAATSLHAARRALRALHHVHRRGPGDRDDHRTRLTGGSVRPGPAAREGEPGLAGTERGGAVVDGDASAQAEDALAVSGKVFERLHPEGGRGEEGGMAASAPVASPARQRAMQAATPGRTLGATMKPSNRRAGSRSSRCRRARSAR